MRDHGAGLPEWLRQSEHYLARADKDTFINKSILALVQLLAKIRIQDARSEGKWRVNTALHLLLTLVLITLVSLSAGFSFVFVALTYILVICCFIPIEEMKRILSISALAGVLTAVIMFPAALWGNHYSITVLPVKVFTTVAAMHILIVTSGGWPELFGALRLFQVPNIIIFVLDITIKYIVLLGEFSLEMLYALRLRSVGRNKNKHQSLSGVAGAMFIRSREMAQELHEAMACRGFSGEYPRVFRFRLTALDGIYSAIHLVLILAFMYTR
ncbi:MAG: energy-coupling factor transporter transmembrane protein EcfT [Peptococcaceae bacterium]|jgi:cobalt/nickel transport system permease protein|nr:energy-coupling factor transporter transmembrane protein EcfT [Peptococcaceae bacterium]